MERTTLTIEGMSCGHCVQAVAAVLRGLEGVKVEEVAVGSATVEHDPARATVEALSSALGEEGYRVRSAGRAG